VQGVDVSDGNTCPETITRTWTVTDNCGNTASVNQVITVNDNIAPAFTFVPADRTVECSGIQNLPVGTPVATDNCSDNVNIVYNGQTRIDGNCPNNYIIIRSWTATDACGNTADASQTITVEDTKSPFIDVPPANLTVECDGTGNVEELNTWLASNGGGVAHDNCGQVSWTNNFNGLSDECGATGSATVIFTVTDDCGNFKTRSATFTIVDTQAPVITCVENITVNADAGVCGANVEVLIPIAVDNCGDVILTNDQNATANASGFYEVGITEVTFTATDECGNSATCLVIITVVDTEVPVITCPEDLVVVADANCSAMVEIPAPVVSDNCGIENIVNSYTNTGNANGIYQTGEYTIIWTATDIHGNVSSCEMQLSVVAAPIAVDDYATTELNAPVSIAILLNDTDCDENIDPTTVSVVSNPANGFTMVDPQNGSIIYTPNAGYAGSDSFTYSVCDLSGLCDEAVVTIIINDIDPQIIYLLAVNDSYTTLVNTPQFIINMENDHVPEIAGIEARIKILVPASHGTIDLHEDMTVIYTPDLNFTGVDQFTYVLYDSKRIAVSDTAIAIIKVVADEARPEVVIYNGITPNGDGRNDLWIIDGIEEYPDNEVLLFNRWTDLVREFTGYNNSTVVWDGTNQFGKEMPDATYYYIVKLRAINKIYTGWVVIHGSNK
jgi:gliding motility-associated-like protein